jgi:hypothetical protein
MPLLGKELENVGFKMNSGDRKAREQEYKTTCDENQRRLCRGNIVHPLQVPSNHGV